MCLATGSSGEWVLLFQFAFRDCKIIGAGGRSDKNITAALTETTLNFGGIPGVLISGTLIRE
jgi:hypothetical protein